MNIQTIRVGVLCAILFISSTFAGRDPVNLGTAGNYAILTKSGISTVPGSAITGDIGVSPIDSTAITGFSLTLTAASPFATSDQVTGKVYAPDYAPPTPALLTTAIGDMETAYTDAAGRSIPDFTELGAGEIGGLTLIPGLYKWGTDVLISTDVTLSGPPDAVWIFQTAGKITVANGKKVLLANGAQPANIFWQTFGSVAIGTTCHFEGNILTKTAINMGTGASINGRLLAQTEVTLQQNVVVKPELIVGSLTLVSSDVVTGPYTDERVLTRSGTVTIVRPATSRFYRLRATSSTFTITGISLTDIDVVITYE